MARRTDGYQGVPGQPVTPERYTSQGLPQPGPNYMRHGEQPGYVYNPYTDLYDPNPKAQQSYYESQGLVDPKPKTPGMLENLAPVAGAAVAYGAGQYGANALGNYLTGSTAANAASPIAEAASTQAAAPVVEATGTQSAGMLGNSAASASAQGATPVAQATGQSATSGMLGMGGESGAVQIGTNLDGTAIMSSGAEGAGASGSGSMLGSVSANAASMGMGPMMGVGLGTQLLYEGAKDMLAGKPASYGDYKKDPMGAGGRAQLAWSTGGLSEIGNLLGLNFGSGKSGDQLKRDAYRDALKERGFYNEDYSRTGPTGTWLPTKVDGGDEIYNLKLDDKGNIADENVRQMAGSIDPLSYIFSQGDEKVASDMTGEITNSLLATGGDKTKVQELYGLMGLNRQTAIEELNKLKEDKKIEDGRYNAYVAAIDRILPATSGSSTAGQSKPSKGTRLSAGVYADGKGGSYRA